MKTKRKHLVTVCLFVGVLLLGVIVLQGCKKSDSGSDTEQETKKWTCPMHPQVIKDGPGKCPTCGMDLLPQKAEKKPGSMTVPAKEIAVAAVQTTCPIMVGNAIDKNLFVEYKGKKVYFCCPGCEPEFEKEPEKYIAKLPQFKD
ncbi:MAG: heavy metal-binding domain-containing protein [Planctomycetota bacterium]|jgi:YHS domain-containing protein